MWLCRLHRSIHLLPSGPIHCHKDTGCPLLHQPVVGQPRVLLIPADSSSFPLAPCLRVYILLSHPSVSSRIPPPFDLHHLTRHLLAPHLGSYTLPACLLPCPSRNHGPSPSALPCIHPF